jgi:hypothetical protein
MPTTDSIQIKFKDARRPLMRFPYSSERVEKIKTVVGRRWLARTTLDGAATTHLLADSYGIRVGQGLLWHMDVSTWI